MASLLEKIGWVEWLSHTNFSFQLGASHPWEVVTTAAGFRYHGLAIADFDGVYGLSRSFQALNKLKKDHLDNGLSLMFGTEIHHSKDHELPLILQDTLVLIAQTHRGHYNLCRLISYGHRAGKTMADVPLDYVLAADITDIIAIQPMRGLVRQHSQRAVWREKARRLRDHFGRERFFFAVSRHLNPAEDSWIEVTIDLGRELGVDCLLSQDAFFHDPGQKNLSDVLHAIRCNRTLDEATAHFFVNHERCLHSLPQIEARFKHLSIYGRALTIGRELAESCQFQLSELRYHYPKEMLPAGVNAQEFLEKITWEYALEHYSRGIPTKVSDLLHHEICLIRQLAFADYFLTVWDIVRWARAQGILCQGRGSAANSAVCFVLGVTSIDPALFDVLFERFISVERGDPPDIDVDFEHERREEVIQYIYERYGREKAAMVANVITFQSRGALRATGKALGVPEVILGRAADVLDSREFRHGGATRTMGEVQALLAADGDGDKSADVPWNLWAEMASRLAGFPSHLGIHSGGFILSDRSLDWLVAQEPATMEGRSVIQWCKEDIEALGFFKIDVLALGMLTAVRKCFGLLKSHYDRDLTLATIPPDDTPTYDMICRADTVGTFQIESRAQMSMLPRLKPRCFYDLVIEVAIIRPGPIQGGMIHPFLRRRDGKERVEFPDPRLEPILRRTLGVPIFQEQVMRIAMAVGGFSPGEANELRRNMGSFSMRGDVDRWIAQLETGMRANGIAEDFIASILQQMKGFSSYGFPESHSASFALLAYASCYLKCHYAPAFFVAVLNSQPMGFYSPHALLQTARHLGVVVRPVCVNRSDWDCTLEQDEGSRDGLAIRMGLRLVRSLRESAVKEFLQRRTSGWATLADFLREGKLSRMDLTALAAADALRAFGLERRSALWLAEAAPFSAFLEDVDPLLLFPSETSVERMVGDFNATGTSLGPHPAAIIKDEDWCYEADLASITSATDITSLRTNTRVTIFGMVLVRQAPPSAKGMVFATLEDETGLINVVLTPQVYSSYRRLFDKQAFLCVRGVLQRQGDAHSVKGGKVLAPMIKEAEVIHLEGEAAEIAVTEFLAKALVQARSYC